MVRLQVDTLCFSSTVFQLIFEAESLIELGAHQLVRLIEWVAQSWDPYFCTGCVGPHAAVCVGARDQTQVHMLAKQALYPLSLLSGPNYETEYDIDHY